MKNSDIIFNWDEEIKFEDNYLKRCTFTMYWSYFIAKILFYFAEKIKIEIIFLYDIYLHTYKYIILLAHLEFSPHQKCMINCIVLEMILITKLFVHQHIFMYIYLI